MTAEMFNALAAPFPADRVSWRVGSVKKDGTAAMALAYIDARDVMERFDEACGPGGWQCRYTHADRKTICDIGVRVFTNGSPELDEHGYWKSPTPFEWVWKADGAGDSDIEAEKGALSDAFKRAAVRWGVGRYLYELPSPWVRIDQYKKILPEEEAKLRKMLEGRLPPKVSIPGVVTGTQLQEAQAEARAPTGRKSSAQAKKDGDDVKIKAEIATADTDGLRDWHENFDSYTAHLPISWLDSIRDMLELRAEELNGAASVADGEAELDAGFRGTMGRASAGGVAGHGRDVARA